jgi:hypothetical protein
MAHASPRARERAAAGGPEARGGTPAGAAARSGTSAASAAPKAARRAGVGPTSQPRALPTGDYRPRTIGKQRTSHDSLAFAFAMKSTDEARSSRGGMTRTFHRRAGVRRLTEVRNRDKGVAGWRPQSFGARRGRATGRSRAFARGVARRRSPTASASRGGFACHGGRSDTPDWPLQCPFRVGRRRWS